MHPSTHPCIHPSTHLPTNPPTHARTHSRAWHGFGSNPSNRVLESAHGLSLKQFQPCKYIQGAHDGGNRAGPVSGAYVLDSASSWGGRGRGEALNTRSFYAYALTPHNSFWESCENFQQQRLQSCLHLVFSQGSGCPWQGKALDWHSFDRPIWHRYVPAICHVSKTRASEQFRPEP